MSHCHISNNSFAALQLELSQLTFEVFKVASQQAVFVLELDMLLGQLLVWL